MQHVVTPPMMARRPALSTGEAAALASCHPTTILRAIERGELHAYRLGPHGDHRIEAAALAKWLRPAHDPEEPAP